MKKKNTLTLLIVLFISIGIYGQLVPPPVPPPPPPGLPIDGGIIFLIISGAIFGFSKLKK